MQSTLELTLDSSGSEGVAAGLKPKAPQRT